MDSGMLDMLPGFRRRFLVTPLPGRVTAAVEDDYHSMAVILHHDGARISGVDAIMALDHLSGRAGGASGDLHRCRAG